MHFGRRRDTRFGTAFPPAPPSRSKNGNTTNTPSEASIAADLPPPPPPAAPAPATGLSFSEFVELIARIAVDNMQQPNYHAVFPTPFSKVSINVSRCGHEVWGCLMSAGRAGAGFGDAHGVGNRRHEQTSGSAHDPV